MHNTGIAKTFSWQSFPGQAENSSSFPAPQIVIWGYHQLLKRTEVWLFNSQVATVSRIWQRAKWSVFWSASFWPLEWVREQSFHQKPLDWSYFKTASAAHLPTALHIYLIIAKHIILLCTDCARKIMVITITVEFLLLRQEHNRNAGCGGINERYSLGLCYLSNQKRFYDLQNSKISLNLE